jgi:hypothetical protein
MKSFPPQYIAIGLIITASIAALLVTRGSDAVLSTYAATGALALGIMSVIWFSWRNALPTDTVAQLLNRTEDNQRKDGRRS